MLQTFCWSDFKRRSSYSQKSSYGKSHFVLTSFLNLELC
ncbi:hypothetical protein LEP1GSC055_2337 [Leptospira borgpetersenii str. Brem 307]|nr:hypothetical protein LEP1GSC055_2337 [Leptospira borgpetersenii str. Brem 307]